MSAHASWAPERLHTGVGKRTFKSPPLPEVDPVLLRSICYPEPDILDGRAPHRESLGVLDISGIPVTYAPKPTMMLSNHPLQPRTTSHSSIALSPSHHSSWTQLNEALGQSRDDVFLGNNLRDTRTQSFINLLRPQEAAGQPPRVTPSRVGAFPTNVRGTLPEDAKMDVARFYRTTNSSTYGNFADIPSLPNTTGPIRQPLYLTSGMGERREA